MNIKLTNNEIDALKIVIAEFDAIFWNMTEDNPEYRKFEYAWAMLENISNTLNK